MALQACPEDLPPASKNLEAESRPKELELCNQNEIAGTRRYSLGSWRYGLKAMRRLRTREKFSADSAQLGGFSEQEEGQNQDRAPLKNESLKIACHKLIFWQIDSTDGIKPLTHRIPQIYRGVEQPGSSSGS